MVLWYSDNVNVARIINNGSPKDELQTLVLEIYAISINNDIKMVSKWIPREENQIADEISKHYDTDDWGIDGETFELIQSKFGQFTVDRFASATNC